MRAKIASFADYASLSTLAAEAAGLRQTRRYAWADILFDPRVAEEADKSGEPFKRAIAWYDAYRYLYGDRNHVLDRILDAGYTPEIEISKQEYLLYYRTWLKRLLLAGWND